MESFKYKNSFNPYLKDSIELGRSFVQPKYWGTRALDYLWYGIGAYLKNNPNIKYLLFGWGSRAFYTTAKEFKDIRPIPVFKAITGDASAMYLFNTLIKLVRLTGFDR